MLTARVRDCAVCILVVPRCYHSVFEPRTGLLSPASLRIVFYFLSLTRGLVD